MFRKPIISTVVLAAAILAFSASAAQAGPVGLGYTDRLQAHSSNQTKLAYLATQPQARPRISPHDGALGRSATVNAYKVMSPPVDPANAQQVPIVVTQAQPVAASDSGFNWTAALLGAGIASAVLLLAGAAASRTKPRRVAL
jgi:hypothetical protein